MTTQHHWDAISRDLTIETLRAENTRYREALERIVWTGNLTGTDHFTATSIASSALAWEGGGGE